MVGFDPPRFWNCKYDHYNIDCKLSHSSDDVPDLVSLLTCDYRP